MSIDRNQYDSYVKSHAPKSPLLRDVAFAFLIGGAICTIGQILTTLWERSGLSQPDAAAATSATLIFLGALLTGLNLYDKIAKYAGAGTIVPITGFANSVVSPALEFKSEGYVLGTGAKMFIICGPVIVYGTAAAMLTGGVMMLLGRI